MQYVLDILNQIPSDAWQVLIAAFFLSPIMIGVKKWLSVHNELVMCLLVVGGAFITAAIAYVQGHPDAAPWVVIPIKGLVTFGISQPLYYSLFKPLQKRTAGWIEEAQKLNEAKRAAALPETSAVPADFS